MLKIYQLRQNQNTFEVTLKYKGVGVRVAFVDGNNYRGIPAKCYTNDPFKQRAIEASQLFRDKEIVLERSIEEDSDRKRASGQEAKAGKADIQERAGNPEETEKPEEGDSLEKKTFNSLAEAILFIATTYQVQVQTPNEARNLLKEKGIKATIKQG